MLNWCTYVHDLARGESNSRVSFVSVCLMDALPRLVSSSIQSSNRVLHTKCRMFHLLFIRVPKSSSADLVGPLRRGVGVVKLQ